MPIAPRLWITLAITFLLIPLALQRTGFATPQDTPIGLANDGDYFNALKLAKKAVKAQPDNADGHGVLGEIEFQMSHIVASRKALEKAIKLNRANWIERASITLAKIDFLEGNDAKATARLAKASSDHWAQEVLPMLMQPTAMTAKRTKHYIVYADQGMVDKGGLKVTSKIMEVVYKSYRKVLPFKIDKMISRVYVFSTKANYSAFSMKTSGDSGEGSVGYFSPSQRILVINADPAHHKIVHAGITADAMDTMFHEGFHQFARMHAPNIGIWFNEGMAEYFGPSQLLGSKLRLGAFVREDPGGYYTRYGRIQDCIQEGTYLPLKEFFRQSPADFNGGEDSGLASRNYAQSWSFVHFLLHSKAMKNSGAKTCKSYFKALRKGHPISKAHRESFGKLNIRKVETEWLKYARTLK